MISLLIHIKWPQVGKYYKAVKYHSRSFKILNVKDNVDGYIKITYKHALERREQTFVYRLDKFHKDYELDKFLT